MQGSCTVDGHTLLITEYLDGGDLWSAFGRDYRYCWQNKGRLVALDIAKALAYLHSREPKVVHQVDQASCRALPGLPWMPALLSAMPCLQL